MNDWVKLKPKGPRPDKHVGVLVRTRPLGGTYDVACYNGIDDEGVERWILSDIRLDPKEITHWSYIEGPKE